MALIGAELNMGLKSGRKIIECILQDGPTMAPCVTSAMSVGNLSQVRDEDDRAAMQEGNNSNNNNNNNKIDYGTNRVSSAVSVGNITKIQSPKVKGK